MPMYIYLCGPMTENTPEQADGWRQEAEKQLRSAGFRVSSPMRNKGMLSKGERMGMKYEKYGDVPELRAQAIFARDQFDVRQADALLANMTEVGRAYRYSRPYYKNEVADVPIPSIGSDFEIAWAYILNKPVILVAPDGNPYAEHPFLLGAANIIRFDTLQQGLDWIKMNLNIYVNGR